MTTRTIHADYEKQKQADATKLSRDVRRALRKERAAARKPRTKS